MARVHYDEDHKAAVVAYAEIAGPVAAAKEFGIDVRVVKGWVADAKPSSALSRARDVALATITKRLAKGEMRDRDAAVAYGILSDKAARYDKPVEADDVTPESVLIDRLEQWIGKTYPPGIHDLALVALLDQPIDDDSPVEPSDWLRSQQCYLTSLGDLETWWSQRREKRTAAYEAQLDENRRAALRWSLPALSDDDLALIARAEAELAEVAE